MKINIELQLEEETALRLLRHAQQCTPVQETPERLTAMIVTQYIHDHYPAPSDDRYTLALLEEAAKSAEIQTARSQCYTMEEFALIVEACDIGRRAAGLKDEAEPGNTPDAATEAAAGAQDGTDDEHPAPGEETLLDPVAPLTDAERGEIDERCEQYDREHEAHMHDLATRSVGDEEEGVTTDDTHAADTPRPAATDDTATTGDDNTEQEGQA